ncbi:hypothetical protein BJ684DRAFT_15690 [Piptocephalis cylindrospora]|uniref:Uncharacterized protein n=1 Tax=Piptocephalis cylindrospora TaxID=1907219 RepID=A0A4P9Y4Q4_9FUNG|nr:hypothetical protein BJ684DRAFT_15690 [Piptocephalis cylindrospora]|eukprot:RKP13956.1 hypothetical protein BJ684DRAFT_15690 [Piptocephalis cylindrospora]
MSGTAANGAWSKYAQDLEEQLARLYQPPSSDTSGDSGLRVATSSITSNNDKATSPIANYEAHARQIGILVKELRVQLEWAKAQDQFKKETESNIDPDARIHKEITELKKSKERADRIIQQQLELLKRWQERFNVTSTMGRVLMTPASSPLGGENDISMDHPI